MVASVILEVTGGVPLDRRENGPHMVQLAIGGTNHPTIDMYLDGNHQFVI